MRLWLASLFGLKRDTVRPGSSPAKDRVSCGAPIALALPQRRDDVEAFIPPPPRHVAPELHANALVALFQGEGRTGPVPHWQLYRRYPELAWMRGFYELSQREILEALGHVCAKVRPKMDRGDGTVGKVVCYVIPAPDWAKAVPDSPEPAPEKSAPTGIVVPIGNIGERKRQIHGKCNRSGTRKSAGKGQRHRADIVSAVA